MQPPHFHAFRRYPPHRLPHFKLSPLRAPELPRADEYQRGQPQGTAGNERALVAFNGPKQFPDGLGVDYGGQMLGFVGPQRPL